MTFELFEIIRQVLFSPITILLIVFFLGYVSFVNYVTYYERREKPQQDKEDSSPKRRRVSNKPKTETEENDDAKEKKNN